MVNVHTATQERYIDRVQRALDQVQLNGGEDMVSRIETLLTEYETQLAATSSAAQSGESALIKADVLEWAPGAVSSGRKAELMRVRTQLAKLLGLDGLGAHWPSCSHRQRVAMPSPLALSLLSKTTLTFTVSDGTMGTDSLGNPTPNTQTLVVVAYSRTTGDLSISLSRR